MAGNNLARGKIVVFALICAFVSGEALAVNAHRSLKKKCVSPAAARTFIELNYSERARPRLAAAARIRSEQNVLVLEADPEILILSNSFDLAGRAIQFLSALQGRYIYKTVSQQFDGAATQSLTLKDDDSYELIFQNFRFPFGKKDYDRCYINSNGNLTFQRPDTDPPNADNLAGGPPRIAAFFSDLDPETSGTIFLNQTSDKVVISWLKVPEFFNHNQFDYGQNTFQIVLHQDGGIDFVYSNDLSATEAFVGIIAGAGSLPLHFVDFTKSSTAARPLRSFLENFHSYESIDLELLMKTIYQSLSDRYDFVTLLSNFDLTPVPGAQAFAIVVRNNVKGIGNPGGNDDAIFHENDKYGSQRRLQNITFLGNLHQYPSDLSEKLPDTDTSILEILAHEVAHRWLSYVRYPKNGKKTDIILGRDDSHWSFFLNSQGSFLEGNQILNRTSKSFVTSTPFQRYSELDLYLMGLIPATDVHDSFYIDDASDFSPDFEFIKDSDPEEGVRFKGTAFPVTISDVIAANGPRKPTAGTSQKEFRHLFVLIVDKDHPATTEELDYVEILRLGWEQFFSEATGKRGSIITSIR